MELFVPFWPIWLWGNEIVETYEAASWQRRSHLMGHFWTVRAHEAYREKIGLRQDDDLTPFDFSSSFCLPELLVVPILLVLGLQAVLLGAWLSFSTASAQEQVTAFLHLSYSRVLEVIAVNARTEHQH